MIKDIYSKRRQIRFFDKENYPDVNLVKQLINITYELVPSKQNLMPYKVHVIGPYNTEVNKELYRLACINELGEHNYRQRFEEEISGNTQLLYAPYNLLFEKRLPEANTFVRERLKEGHPYNNLDPKSHHLETNDTKIEIGMFCSILTGLCMEKNIDVSYTACLPSIKRNRVTDEITNPFVNLPFINENIFLALSLGYRHPTVDENYMLSRLANVGEIKPNINDVINWQ